MSNRVYVGNLPMDIRTRDVEDIFYKYGRIRNIEVKAPSRPPAFAFVEFESSRDAEDAIRGRDGYEFEGERLRVEAANNSRRNKRERDSRPRGNQRPVRKSEFQVVVSGLPKTASWQDLKDCMRAAGDVGFAEVDRRGTGVVEFFNREDMEYAIDKLDGTEFKNRYETAKIRVRRQSRRDSRSRSRSISRDRNRDRSRSQEKRGRRSRSPSHSRSRDRSDRKVRSKSHSRSRTPMRSGETEHQSPKFAPKPAEANPSTSPAKPSSPQLNAQQSPPRAKSPSPVASRSPVTKAASPSPNKQFLSSPTKRSISPVRADTQAMDVDTTNEDSVQAVPHQAEEDGIDELPPKSPSPKSIKKAPESAKKASSMTVVQLREELKSRGLDTKGVKAVLVSRLEEAWASE